MKVFSLFFVSAFYSSVAFSAAYELKVEATPGYSDIVSVESWDINDTRTNPMNYWSGTINPGVKDDDIYFSYTYIGTGGNVLDIKAFTVPGARNAKTMGELGKLFIKHGFLGKRFDGQRNAGVIGKACWRLGYLNSAWGTGSAFYFDTACTYAEYPPTVCRIDQPALEINHGTLTTREVNGNSAYADFYVTCSSAMSVYVISPTQINSVVLSQASGLRSDITINDRKLGDGVRISASTSPTRLRITSTLNGFTSQLEGEFSGSFTIIIAPE
ncbi:hypothetical protein SMQE08_30840 [Serratia marcescens]|jgi:hypothetical protein|nr:hypothetical protein [Serratia marcescens]BEO38996.1 hypothetical protein SMQE08_30840 [Serratia marcescens]